MPTYLRTTLVGDDTGKVFSDIALANADGSFVLDDASLFYPERGKNVLDIEHPIKRILVCSGAVVDGIAILYKNKGIDNASMIYHGSPPSQIHYVNFDIERVFGRAGFQSSYSRNLINSIGFVIFDAKHATTRIVGPFGNADGTNEGEPFYVSDVVAFGGYDQDTTHCLSGLFFVKRVESL